MTLEFNGLQPNLYSKTLAQEIQGAISALLNSHKHGSPSSVHYWEDYLTAIEQEFLPHGSGFDSGCVISPDESTHDFFVINTSYHHMDENGMYCGWSNHRIKVLPSHIHGIDFKIVSQDHRDPYDKRKNSLKSYFMDYLHETFHSILTESRKTQKEIDISDMMQAFCIDASTANRIYALMFDNASANFQLLNNIKGLHHINDDAYDKLTEINVLIGAYGVENNTEQANASEGIAPIDVSYVNQGEMYALTVLHDNKENKFILATLGDFIEDKDNSFKNKLLSYRLICDLEENAAIDAINELQGSESLQDKQKVINFYSEYMPQGEVFTFHAYDDDAPWHEALEVFQLFGVIVAFDEISETFQLYKNENPNGLTAEL